MKILMCCQEYVPEGSGIANLVYNLRKSMVKAGHEVHICSPIGPHHWIEKARGLINRTGGIGIAYFWYRAGKLIRSIESNYDLIFLHNPLLFTGIKSDRIRCVVHTLYYHSFREYAWKDMLKWPYHLVMLLLERIGYRKLRDFRFIVTSPRTVNELEHYGIGKDDEKECRPSSL